MSEVTRMQKKDIYRRSLIRQAVEAYGSADHIDLEMARLVIAAFIAEQELNVKTFSNVDTLSLRYIAYGICMMYVQRDYLAMCEVLDQQMRGTI